MKLRWNRKGGPFDFRKMSFFENFRKCSKHQWYVLNRSNIDYLSYFEHSEVVRSVFEVRNIDSRKLHFLKNLEKSSHFEIRFRIDFPIVLYIFFLHESLYEPSRQWLGWQFTGGPKLTIRLLLDSLVVHQDTLSYLGLCSLSSFKDYEK